MRLDLFLKVSRLIVRRTVAQEVCAAGAVEINDQVAKPSREIRVGDVLSLRLRGRKLKVKVLHVPQSKTLKGMAASDLYEVLSEERKSMSEELFSGLADD
ncbi:MAG TPA: RNA-binding S4 domain-containing protein [Acidobacteriota bacterium]|nr:RNA-binding S4 domain-containing protein [Acidobacteriota bacterium]HNB73459.1 RNA-binding S4 domain-containing protein [Acidobacteriota bacterium]HNC45479.1 RNA-binding S4 domain-containing protein [Acidobacteriota bacterium]HNH82577.1 RNA-binding S4 domain-containing protein [Acidobacteriota bacterium]